MSSTWPCHALGMPHRANFVALAPRKSGHFLRVLPATLFSYSVPNVHAHWVYPVYSIWSQNKCLPYQRKGTKKNLGRFQ